jgi:C4-dicarboxylate-specific signal transduction histidine kinase
MLLNYDQNSFSFEYAALNYLFPEKNRYAYKVDGLDDDWHYIGTRHYTAYTNLDPGHYTFRVKACNNDGYWNEEGIAIAITITPPFWKTWWFMTATALLIAFIILGYIRYRTRSLRKQTTLLEEKVTLRTHELSEKNSELTDTMTNLRSTQDQLIQSEKMASLGQLTAGIAHEIQNPLNFVTNFSDSSLEIIKEIHESKDEFEKQELMTELTKNIEKISGHGKRADNIIKSMLRHSHGIQEEKRPTAINRVCDEFLMLAYHSIRASHPDFNCAIEKKFREDMPKVNLMAQEITRVLLNLFTNAFHALKERKEKEPGFSAIITVSTMLNNQFAEIRIRDNGTGIPNAIIDKIFQPFFTTKKSGEGTGLGLSISYDIVKAHGGNLKAESKEGEFTEFCISLPVT